MWRAATGPYHECMFLIPWYTYGSWKLVSVFAQINISCWNITFHIVMYYMKRICVIPQSTNTQNQKVTSFPLKTRGVSHCELAIYNKLYLKAKEELYKFKYFTKQKYNLQKNPSQQIKILQDIILTLWLISSFNTSQNIPSFKNPQIKIDLLLPRGQNPLSYYTL
jgi:hypothetical protein